MYNFSQVPQEPESESNLELEKTSLLKNMIAILKFEVRWRGWLR